MVKKLSIGVIGIQGAVSEHIISMQKTLKKNNTLGNVFVINNKEQIKNIDGIIIPGGESSTISRILHKSELYDILSERIRKKNLPIMGTCAGCIILASKLVTNNEEVKILNAMDIEVKRNAFGRQKESFEKEIMINGFLEPYNAVFIRAPEITKIWNKCKILAKIEKKIIMARQENMLALSFHPELTDDLRIHKYFLDIISKPSL